jgi:hypothetical protein
VGVKDGVIHLLLVLAVRSRAHNVKLLSPRPPEPRVGAEQRRGHRELRIAAIGTLSPSIGGGTSIGVRDVHIAAISTLSPSIGGGTSIGGARRAYCGNQYC